jgi:hypothetical protein
VREIKTGSDILGISFYHDFPVDIAKGCRPGFDSWRGQEIFLYSTVSRQALWPTQPPVKWVPGTLPPGVKRPGCEADHSHPPSSEVENDGPIPLLSHTSSWLGV